MCSTNSHASFPRSFKFRAVRAALPFPKETTAHTPLMTALQSQTLGLKYLQGEHPFIESSLPLHQYPWSVLEEPLLLTQKPRHPINDKRHGPISRLYLSHTIRQLCQRTLTQDLCPELLRTGSVMTLLRFQCPKCGPAALEQFCISQQWKRTVSLTQ